MYCNSAVCALGSTYHFPVCQLIVNCQGDPNITYHKRQRSTGAVKAPMRNSFAATGLRHVLRTTFLNKYDCEMRVVDYCDSTRLHLSRLETCAWNCHADRSIPAAWSLRPSPSAPCARNWIARKFSIPRTCSLPLPHGAGAGQTAVSLLSASSFSEQSAQAKSGLQWQYPV
jgi:hypothetical protein